MNVPADLFMSKLNKTSDFSISCIEERDNLTFETKLDKLKQNLVSKHSLIEPMTMLGRPPVSP
jgi:hypothetical protein